MDAAALWQRYQHFLCRVPSLGLTLDVSRMRFDEGFFARTAPLMRQAFEAMDLLERGAVANPDENRLVGHYWLRTPDLAPTADIAAEVRDAIADIKAFAAGVHSGTVRPAAAPRFTGALSIGIGGSALGPMFVADALGHSETDRLRVSFID